MNSKQYNNIIGNTLEHDKAVQGTDSLETARVVFNNMGVALPSGDMAEVSKTLKTNDYMGWRACTAEEAQAAADRGVAAIGVTEDEIIILAANDEDEPVAANASVMTLSAEDTVSPASEMEYYAYSYGTTSGGSTITTTTTTVQPEAVYIKPDGIYNKVVFSNSGEEWYCINEDLVFSLDTSSNNALSKRSTKNLLVGKNPDYGYKEYTTSQLRLLYSIDPYGVADYVKNFAFATSNSVAHEVEIKDEFFKKIFGREPYYFDRSQNGDWYFTDKKDKNIYEVISESESFFGTHVPWLSMTTKEVIELVCSLANMVIGLVTGTGFITKFLSEHNTISFMVKVFTVAVNGFPDGLGGFVSSSASQMTSDGFEYALKATKTEWAHTLVSKFSDINSIVSSLNIFTNFTAILVDYCDNIPGYSVFVELQNGEIWNLSDVKRLMDNYS